MGKRFGSLFVVSTLQLSLLGLANDYVFESISFELLENHLIVVKGTIGSLKELNFILDTGTATTVISPHVAGKLKLKGKNREILSGHSKKMTLKEVSLPEIGIGQFTTSSTRALVAELNFQGKRIDALIGLDLLRQKSFTIDYEARVIHFDRVSPSDSFVHFPGSLPFIMVVMKMNEQVLLLEVDTGAPGLILFEDQVKNKVDMRKGGHRRDVQHLGGKTTLKPVNLINASIGTGKWSELSGYLMNTGSRNSSDMDGLIDLSQLGVKRVSFDFKRYILSWEM